MVDEPHRLSEVIARGSLARLRNEAERRRMETAAVRRLLPTEEAAHLVSAATNEAGELTLVMDTPGWAARVRFAVGSLPNARVKIRVAPGGA